MKQVQPAIKEQQPLCSLMGKIIYFIYARYFWGNAGLIMKEASFSEQGHMM